MYSENTYTYVFVGATWTLNFIIVYQFIDLLSINDDESKFITQLLTNQLIDEHYTFKL